MPAGIEAQTEQVFDNLAAVLAEAGTSLDHVVKATVFVTDLGDFAKLNAIYAKRFGDHKPARSTVQVAALPRGACVEIELVAEPLTPLREPPARRPHPHNDKNPGGIPMRHMDQAALAAEQEQEAQDFHRGLKDRHVQLIAIGGAIGVGLFLGSAGRSSQAGPGLCCAYAAGGRRHLLHHAGPRRADAATGRSLAPSPPTPRSSSALGPASPPAGPTGSCGWSPAWPRSPPSAVYIHYWFPDVPQWIPALVTLGVLYGVNLVAVKLFGELEFWFALIKIVAIIALLVVGPSSS